ncbi:hypothetical protein ACFL2Q_12475 [Thermodesulfobacteriota bacterium]
MEQKNSTVDPTTEKPETVPAKPEAEKTSDKPSSPETKVPGPAKPPEQAKLPGPPKPPEQPKPVEKKLTPKEELGGSLSLLADRMRANQTGWLAHFGYSYAEGRFAGALDECVTLQKELAKLPDDPEAILDFQARVDKVEAHYNRSRFRLVQVPSFVIILAATVAVVAIFAYSGLFDYIQDKLEIRRLIRYVLLAVTGAALYLLTSAMSRMSRGSAGEADSVSVGPIFVRIAIAIIVPTIIVVVTFKKDGQALKFQEIAKSPDLWSFLCGYSCNIVIQGLNKVVEKVSKMIDSV